MTDRTPPLTWLRAFEATARHLSFTRAGEELHLTQSAVSQHVRALEDHLSQQLFKRAHRQLFLTEAGRLLLPDVTAGLALLGQGIARFRTAEAARTLRIATSASIARHLLVPNLGAFRARHPGLQVEIKTTVWPDDFVGAAADIEIRFGRAALVGAGATALEPSSLHVIGRPGLGAPDADPRSPLIEAVGLSQSWRDIIPGRVADIRADTHGLAVDFALAGAGLALTHSLITRAALRTGAVEIKPYPEIAATEGYFLAVTRDRPDIPAQEFADWFLAQVQIDP